MDPMDIDQSSVVPDTPEKLATQNVSLLGDIGRQNRSGRLGKGSVFHEEGRNWVNVSDNVGGRQIRPPRGLIRSGKPGHIANHVTVDPRDSSSFRNGPLARKEVASNGVVNGNKYLEDLGVQNKKPLTISPSYVSQDRSVVDLTECSAHKPEPTKSFLSDGGVSSADVYKEGCIVDDGRTSCGRRNRSRALHNGKEESSFNNAEELDPSVDIVRNHNSLNTNTVKSDLTIHNAINLPRPTRQKRLVRNGCISPNNIAKGKEPVQENNIESGAMEYGDYDSGQNAVDYSSRSWKGKGVLLKESDGSRRSVSINEKSSECNVNGDAVLSLSKSGGRRTPHGKHKTFNYPTSFQPQHITIEDDSPSCVSRSCGNKGMRRNQHDDTDHLDLSDQIANDLAQPARQVSYQPRTQFSGSNGHHKTKDTLAKRQKQGSIPSSHAECSQSAADDSDVIVLGSGGQPRRSKLTVNKMYNGVSNIEPIISIDEATPEVQHASSHSTGCSGSNEDATVTQVELDEMLARELQEQLYNEEFTVGTSEIDTYVALAQQQGASRRSAPRERHPVSNLRGSQRSLISTILPPSSSSRSYQNNSRRGAHARAPTSSRLARMRYAFPGQPRTISSSRGRNSPVLSTRGTSSLFPSSMDVEMRMHILEALESFSDMEVGTSFLQNQRDFNETDYEMLLALDDNNHQHAGATPHQINGLPESTVQRENLEEACSICLEAPTIGEVIRHLPCLHKFHKDCIDPWLRRRTSCPVCKSSIT